MSTDIISNNSISVINVTFQDQINEKIKFYLNGAPLEKCFQGCKVDVNGDQKLATIGERFQAFQDYEIEIDQKLAKWSRKWKKRNQKFVTSLKELKNYQTLFAQEFHSKFDCLIRKKISEFDIDFDNGVHFFTNFTESDFDMFNEVEEELYKKMYIKYKFTHESISESLLALLEYSVDELDYFEDKHYRWEQEVETAVVFAKELLKINGQVGWNKDGKPTLADECSMFLENQYKEAFKGKNNIHDIPQAQADLRTTWDQKFLDFIRTKIWEYLKTNDLITEPWAPADSYNKTSNAIFGNVLADPYRFAAKVLDQMSSHILGF